MPSEGETVKDLTKLADRTVPPGHTAAGELPLGDLMRTAQQTLVRVLDRALAHAGYDDVSAANVSVLNAVETDGTRLASLVDRVGRTKQATSELAGHLVRRGYLTLEPDPSDGRAKLYRPTPAGARLLATCADVVGDYEDWLDDALGAEGLVRLRGALTAIVEHGA